MLISKRGSILEVDIHGMLVQDAQRQLEFLLTKADRSVREMVVIHGYSHGHALRDMVRFQLKHPRIETKLISLNQGQTRILLRS